MANSAQFTSLYRDLLISGFINGMHVPSIREVCLSVCLVLLPILSLAQRFGSLQPMLDCWLLFVVPTQLLVVAFVSCAVARAACRARRWCLTRSLGRGTPTTATLLFASPLPFSTDAVSTQTNLQLPGCDFCFAPLPSHPPKHNRSFWAAVSCCF